MTDTPTNPERQAVADPMNDVVSRLEKAEAGSRELDYAINESLNDPFWSIRVPADWTTSLDAALALAESLGLDGWNTLYAAMMNWKAHDPRGPLSRELPLAVCIAILKARPSAGTGSHEGEDDQ